MMLPFDYMAAKLVSDHEDDANDAEPLLRSDASQRNTVSSIGGQISGPSLKCAYSSAVHSISLDQAAANDRGPVVIACRHAGHSRAFGHRQLQAPSDRRLRHSMDRSK
jgi:hypothetical protein